MAKERKKMECSKFLHLYNLGVNIDYQKADLLLYSQFMEYRRDKIALKIASRLLLWASLLIGRLLTRRDGEVREQAEKLANENEVNIKQEATEQQNLS